MCKSPNIAPEREIEIYYRNGYVSAEGVASQHNRFGRGRAGVPLMEQRVWSVVIGRITAERSE